MRIYFRGIGEAQHLTGTRDHPVCPRVGEDVEFGQEVGDDQWTVRTVIHTPASDEYDAYVVVGWLS